MTDPLRVAAQAVVAKAELDDSGYDGECLDYHVPIPTLDALRAALAADAARPVLSPEWHAELALVEAESRHATLDEVVRVVEGLPGSGARGIGTGGNADVIVQTAGDFIWRAALLDAVKALRSPERTCHHPDSYFDRSLCATDDWMHNRCSECGMPLDGECGHAALAAPKERDQG